MNSTDKETLKDHAFYQLGDRVEEICKPLFNSYPINHFGWGRVYKNKSVTMVVSDRDWTRKFLASDYKCFSTDYNRFLRNQRIHTWSSSKSIDAI
ncbi:MAG: hypothetical protein HQK53_11120 [Oligoflexia bacterium]|nr:hypothetical protein [Oligoflexia bacterium]